MTIKRKFWIIHLVLLIIICCPFSLQKLGAEYSQDASIKIFFSPPKDLNHELAEYIDGAQESIKACFYGIKSEEVAYALIKAHLKGVKVQIVIDEGRLFIEDSFYPKLKNFGLAKKDVITKGLMHNKFCIIDERIVWTGSYNPNPYTIYENNDAVVIESQELANMYTHEFEKLWGYRITSQGKDAKRRMQIAEDAIVEVYFSPEDSPLTLEKILKLLKEAKSSIYFAQFTITRSDIARVLIKKAKEGIDVRGIVECEQIGNYSQYPSFKLMNMNVRKDKNYCFAFHHKFFIIDEETVVTGSLNPTMAGFKKNRENVLIIHSPEIAKEYLAYFQSVP